jgi:hypothetical protein
MLPGLPQDLAENFWSSMTQGNVLTNQGMPYAFPDDTVSPPRVDNIVVGGPTFIGSQPGGGLPIERGGPGMTVNAYTRSAIIPDPLLPLALKRQGILNQKPLFTFNEFDANIAREARFWEWVREHGGLKSCCRIPELGAPIYSIAPWVAMPSNGLRIGPNDGIFFLPTNQISGGGPFTGVDTLLGTFRCEIGYDGVITHFICGFTGSNFDDGSGNIVWRLQIGQRFAKGVGNVTFTFGSLQTALTVPGSSYRMISGQTVKVFANIPPGSPVSGGQVFGGFLGWVYPRR